MSAVPFNKELPPNTSWRGSPVRPLDGVDAHSRTWHRTRVATSVGSSLLHVLGLYIIGGALGSSVYIASLFYGYVQGELKGTVSVALENAVGAIVAYFSYKIIFCFFVILLKWLMVGHVKPGKNLITTWRLFCHWTIDRILSSDLTKGFLADVFSNVFLQNFVTAAFGAKINVCGGSQLSGAGWHSDLDLIEVGGDVWFGSNVALYGTHFDGPYMVFEAIKIESGVMVAEGCVVSVVSYWSREARWARPH